MEKGLVLGLEQKMYKVNQEHLVVPVSKEVLDKTRQNTGENPLQ